MGGLLGPVGGLEELACATELQAAPAVDSVLKTTTALDGAEFVQVRASTPPRVWDVSVGTAAPEEMKILGQLERQTRLYRQTLVYYPEDALAENMLDPDAALMSPRRWTDVMPGGPQAQLTDHLPGPRYLWAAATNPNGAWAHLSNIPVPHQRTLTASLYVVPYKDDQAHFWVDELDPNGQTVTVRKLQTTTVKGRLVFTFTTHPRTVALTFGVARAAAVMMPALTLTDTVRDWAEGAGCMSAVVMGPPRKTVQLAVPDLDWGSRSAFGWTIREIGRGSRTT